jgi:hypothetical protein
LMFTTLEYSGTGVGLYSIFGEFERRK